jgi:hypothetical protein
MFTTSYRDTTLNALGGFIGLITAITDWRAGTVTEASYTGYGTRPAWTKTAAANTSPTGGRQVTNNATVTFPENTGANQDVIAFGVWSASTAGTLHAVGLLDTDAPIFGTSATSDTITAYAHGLEADQRVFVLAAPGAVISTGLSENTAYYVRGTGLTADTFTLSTTQGGAAVDLTANGASLFIPYKARTVATGATPSFATSALVVQV